jgi:hypothetical protein
MTVNINAMIIEANWKAKPSERATARYAGVEVEKGICKGVDQSLLDTDYGQLRNAEGITFWFKAEDEPTEWGGETIIGKIIEINVAERGYVALRVIGRGVMQGGVQLVLATKDGPR